MVIIFVYILFIQKGNVNNNFMGRNKGCKQATCLVKAICSQSGGMIADSLSSLSSLPPTSS